MAVGSKESQGSNGYQRFEFAVALRSSYDWLNSKG